MQSLPKVSIVIPLFNDDQWVTSAIDSCINQTLSDIEIICVDDASTDGTVKIVEMYQQVDARVRLVRQKSNLSAFQARRSGVEAASAAYILFLDGDDELVSSAAELALNAAKSEEADIVGFGVSVIRPDGKTGGRLEKDLQPKHRVLFGENLAPAIFPRGEVAQGHIWRNLYKTDLLRAAYSGFPEELVLNRANDIPVTFRAFMEAARYYSIPDKLYRYYFSRGISGRRVHSIEGFGLYLGAVDSIDSIDANVRAKCQSVTDSDRLLQSYESVRLSVIGNVLNYCLQIVDLSVQRTCIELLCARVAELEVIHAAVVFCPAALDALSRHAADRFGELPDVRSVLLHTGNLKTGGVQGVVVAQAQHLVEAGFKVSIAVETLDKISFAIPDTVQLFHVAGNSLSERLRDFERIIHLSEADVVINHHILYQERWPYFAMIAGALNVPTIGWIHNFALRPMLDFTTRGTFLKNHLPLLHKVVTLSAADVAFWKLRGVTRAVYLPNPPSPLLRRLPVQEQRKTIGEVPVELMWWGRLQQSTKQVRDLVRVAGALRDLGVNFRLTIVGPETSELTHNNLRADARRLGVDDAVVVLEPVHGQDLIDVLSKAHLLISTSVIEGFPLTLVEAQSLGIPVVMYELPWLAYLQGNEGVLSVPQGHVNGMAEQIAALTRNSSIYAYHSKAALSAAYAVQSMDFSELYTQLLTDTLPETLMPEPTLDDARLLLDQMIAFSDRNVRVQKRAADRKEEVLARQTRSAERRERALEQRERATRSRERIFDLVSQMRLQQRELNLIINDFPVTADSKNVEKLARQVEVLQNSLSFRLGRALTFVPRKFRGLLRNFPKRQEHARRP